MQLHDFDGGKIWLDTSASEMQSLMAATRWEWRKVAYMRQHLKPGMVFADVGAFNGYFSLIASKLVGESGQVFAFEPDEDCIAWLDRNLEANGCQNVARYWMAVGASDQHITMFKGEHPGWSSRIRQSRHVFQCHQVRLDTAIQTRLDMIKIDVEGSELNVLRGAEITLFAARHLHILLDHHPELGVTPEGIEDFLLSHGFGLYSIRDDFAPIERIPADLVELLAVK